MSPTSASDPVFNILSSIISNCGQTSQLSHCDAAEAVVDDVAENGPFWLKSMMDEERSASIKRWV